MTGLPQTQFPIRLKTSPDEELEVTTAKYLRELADAIELGKVGLVRVSLSPEGTPSYVARAYMVEVVYYPSL